MPMQHGAAASSVPKHHAPHKNCTYNGVLLITAVLSYTTTFFEGMQSILLRLDHTGTGGCTAAAVVAADGDGGSVVLPSLSSILSLLASPQFSFSFFAAVTVLPVLLLATAPPLLLPLVLLLLLVLAAAFVAAVHTDL
jgi:hypothetical protein